MVASKLTDRYSRCSHLKDLFFPDDINGFQNGVIVARPCLCNVNKSIFYVTYDSAAFIKLCCYFNN